MWAEPGEISAVVNVGSSVEAVQTSTSGNLGPQSSKGSGEFADRGYARTQSTRPAKFSARRGFGGNTGGAVNVHGSRDRALISLSMELILTSRLPAVRTSRRSANPDSVQEFQIVTSNFTAN
jgi:hypothetical protein